jgi:hypothetical protein
MIAVLVAADRPVKNVFSMWGRVMDGTSRMGLEIPLMRWHQARAMWS